MAYRLHDLVKVEVLQVAKQAILFKVGGCEIWVPKDKRASFEIVYARSHGFEIVETHIERELERWKKLVAQLLSKSNNWLVPLSDRQLGSSPLNLRYIARAVWRDPEGNPVAKPEEASVFLPASLEQFIRRIPHQPRWVVVSALERILPRPRGFRNVPLVLDFEDSYYSGLNKLLSTLKARLLAKETEREANETDASRMRCIAFARAARQAVEMLGVDRLFKQDAMALEYLTERFGSLERALQEVGLSVEDYPVARVPDSGQTTLSPRQAVLGLAQSQPDFKEWCVRRKFTPTVPQGPRAKTVVLGLCRVTGDDCQFDPRRQEYVPEVVEWICERIELRGTMAVFYPAEGGEVIHKKRGPTLRIEPLI